MNKFTKVIASMMLTASILGVLGCDSKGKESAKEKTQDFVDLGLPSGTLWATCNIGANTPENNGNYFAWGEVQHKDYYWWDSYLYCNSAATQLTKYCTHPDFGFNGYIDTLFLMDLCDDAANVNCGDGWMIPNYDDWNELLYNCKQSWTYKGLELMGPSGNSVFFPFSGYIYKSDCRMVGKCGYYWSNMIETKAPNNAWCFRFCSDFWEMRYEARFFGMSIRPIRKIHKAKDSGVVEIEDRMDLIENQDYKILLIDRQKLVDNYFIQIFTDDLSEENVGNLAKSLYNQYYHGKNINIELFDYEFSTDFLERYLTLNKGYSDCTGEDYVLLADHSICFLMFGSKTGDYYPMQDDYSLYVSYGGKNWKKGL